MTRFETFYNAILDSLEYLVYIIGMNIGLVLSITCTQGIHVVPTCHYYATPSFNSCMTINNTWL